MLTRRYEFVLIARPERDSAFCELDNSSLPDWAEKAIIEAADNPEAASWAESHKDGDQVDCWIEIAFRGFDAEDGVVQYASGPDRCPLWAGHAIDKACDTPEAEAWARREYLAVLLEEAREVANALP